MTDRCDRCDRRVDESSSVIYHLPTPLSERTRPTRTGWVFCSLRATRAGLPPSAPSAPSESMGGGAHLSAWSPWRLSRGGKEGREKVEHEGAKRSSSYLAPQAPEPQRKLKDSRRLREEKQAKIQRQIRLPRPSAATPKTASPCISNCIFGCILRCILNMPPPPPEIRGKTPFPTRHHPPPASLVSGWCRVFMWFLAYLGAGVVS